MSENQILAIYKPLIHTHPHRYWVNSSRIIPPDPAAAGTFVTTQPRLLAGTQTGGSGQVGIPRPPSSPNPFHLQKTHFSSHLTQKTVATLWCSSRVSLWLTHLSNSSTIRSSPNFLLLLQVLGKEKVSIHYWQAFYSNTFSLKRSAYPLREHFHLAFIPHFMLKLVFPGWQHSVSLAKFSVVPLVRDNTSVSEILAIDLKRS